MTALTRLAAEIARIKAQDPIEAATEQLEQVQARIREALATRDKAPTQRAWREVNQRLHNLYMMEHDMRRDLEGLRAA